MEETKSVIRNILAEHTSGTALFKRNLVKEYLQTLVLSYIYEHPKYSALVFYGGSCLAHCFSLPRLSEDLDFVDIEGKVDLHAFGADIEKFFREKTDLKVSVKIQKFRIYLKFPILRELDLAKGKDESDVLLLKVEIFQKFDFCAGYIVEVKPLFRFDKSMLVKTFDLPTLMSTKLRAVLYRTWEKTNRKGERLVAVKGRDYFDFMWYLEKGIRPNIACIEEGMSTEALKERLLDLVEKIDARSIILDLENFISDRRFVENLGTNIKDILQRQVKEVQW